jgi:hypothetical protein
MPKAGASAFVVTSVDAMTCPAPPSTFAHTRYSVAFSTAVQLYSMSPG